MKNEIRIVNFEKKYALAFKELNQEWIIKFFKMEAEDHYTLDNPQENIIDKGGYILIALLGNEVVGVCALKKMEDPDYKYELAKMGVSPSHRGKKIGLLLGEKIIELARSLGSKKIFLESNTVLTPAINLYRKLGFTEIYDRPSPYERSNIQMELKLEA